MSEGWICPKCGRVYSPTATECAMCNSGSPPISPAPPPWAPSVPFSPWYPPTPWTYPYERQYWPPDIIC